MNFLSRLAEKIRRVMAGRNGADALNLALVILAVIWSTVWRYTRLWPLTYLSWIILALVIFRMFSRNLPRRYRENQGFLNLWKKIKGFFSGLVTRLKDRDHRYFRCPHCRQRVRVPKGRGKIRITCPSCRTQFEKKS